MNLQVLKSILKEYEIKNNNHKRYIEKKQEELYEKLPQVKELIDEKNSLSLKTARSVINLSEVDKEVELENLELKIKGIDSKIEKILKENNISKEDLEPKYDCNICKDTGYITINGETKYCSCITQRAINEIYKQSNMNKLEEENFETFDIGFYSNKVDAEKYGTQKSPLENIENIKKIAVKFSKNIDSKEQKNLLFTGNTGLGKTFIANSIANEVIKQNKTVIYQTAPNLMDMVMEYKFNFESTDALKERYKKIFEVDLLIIDDLGTETMTNNKFTELFNIINTRFLNNKKIIISTNLTLNQLYSNYDERVISRLIGESVICKFIGEDIRLKKKKISV